MRTILLLVFFFILNGCTKQSLDEAVTLEIQKGSHNSTPYLYREGHWIDWEYELDFSEADYDFQETFTDVDSQAPDQLDWNKFGVKENYLRPMRGSYHMGWRKNKWTGYFEFTHYANDLNGAKIMEPPCFSSTGKVRVRFFQQGNTLLVDIEGNVKAYQVEPGLLYLIPPYFGGNRTAPSDLNIKITRIK